MKETAMTEATYTENHAKAGIDAALAAIETWPNQYPGYEIEIQIPEFTSVCPKTGLPDFGKLTLYYIPDKKCLELKSFKMYTVAFRNLGIFYENVVNRVLRDVVAAAQPVSATVVGKFTPRGGLQSRVVASWSRERGYGVDPEKAERSRTATVAAVSDRRKH
ncbi:MAG: preQ(1) synthase [Terriglobia bacterium]